MEFDNGANTTKSAGQSRIFSRQKAPNPTKVPSYIALSDIEQRLYQFKAHDKKRRTRQYILIKCGKVSEKPVRTLVCKLLTLDVFIHSELTCGAMESIAISPLLFLPLFAVALIVGGSMGVLLTRWQFQRQQDECLQTQRQSEAALRQSETKSRCLVDANLIGVYVADFNGTIYESNEAFLEMVGYSQADLQAGRLNWVDMTPPEYEGVDQQAIAEQKATGACKPFEKEYYHRSGSRVPVLFGCAVFEPTQGRSIGFVLDLTVRKQVEVALKQSEAKLRRLIEANLIGVTVAHRYGQIFEANDVFLDMVGYTREDLYAGRLDWTKLTPIEHVEVDRRATEELANTGTFTPFEKEYWRKDGSRIPVLIGHATFDESNQISIGFVLDLSDRKRAEAASVLEERSRMAREIHDTLAQAFTSILVHLEVASHKLKSDPAIVRQCVETSYELAQSGLAEARQSVAALRPHYLTKGDLYNALCLLGKNIFSHRSTQFVSRCQGERYGLQPEIEHHLLRIGQEALMNACKYANATLVELNLLYEPEQCSLRVQDNGVGFEPDRVDSDHHFGLSGMTERSHRIGAMLKVQTALGQGTEVRIVVRREAIDEFN